MKIIKTIYFILLIILLNLSIPCFANNNDNHIEEFSNTFSIRLSIYKPYFDLSLRYQKDNGSELEFSDYIDYISNTNLTFGIEVFYNSFGFSFSSEVEDEPDKYITGKTEYYDLQLYYYSRKFAGELFYQKYKGYYLDDPGNFGYDENDPETNRSDLKTFNIGFNLYYIFSNDFSLNAAMKQTERQNKWDWSFLAMISLNYFKVESNYSLIPPSQQVYYGDDAVYSGGSYTGIGFAPGIALTIPIAKFYISSAMFIGAGSMYKRYDSLSGEKKETGSFLLINWKGSLGFNGDTRFGGLSFSIHSYDTSAWSGSEISVMTFIGYVEFFAGIRV